MMVPFVNEALVDFRQESNKIKMQGALDAVKKDLGKEYPLIIGGEKVWTERKITSNNPSQKDEIFNRKCTGALVGVHPFGGFNMSGTDSKAGGPDYLLLFTQAKSISERF
ncbi:MAG: hypothetical protein ACYCVD_01940 [Desulfitobacteriaceae bacterium]